MKQIALRILAGVVVLSLALVAAYAGSEPPEQELPEGQTRVVVSIKGMTCGACCTKVETAMKELDGIVAAKADYQEGWATITYVEDKVTVKKIVDTINSETSFKASMPKSDT